MNDFLTKENTQKAFAGLVVFLIAVYAINKFTGLLRGWKLNKLAVDTKDVRDKAAVAVLAKRMLTFFEADTFLDKFDPFRESEFKDFVNEANGYSDEELKTLVNLFDSNATDGNLYEYVKGYYLLIWNDTDRDILIGRLERLGAI